MKLFTVGPVEMYPQTLRIEGTQLPYFRTPEFGEVMKNVERNFKKTINAPTNSYFIGLTSSGTGAMVAAVANILRRDDKALVINGGSFGNRFAQICDTFSVPYDMYRMNFGEGFSKEEFERFDGKGYTALLVNACETSTGQLYDLDYLGNFCKKNNMYFIVDAVSAYLCDPIDMQKQNIDVLLTASQKALALSPGVAPVVISERIYRDRVSDKKALYYFDFNTYIENQKRGQPPFTSAIGIMLAMNERLNGIVARKTDSEIALHAKRAEYFRGLIEKLPISVQNFNLSNCCTAIQFPQNNASEIYEKLKSLGFVLCPSGGEWKDKQLRVGHMGNLSLSDYEEMVSALSTIL